jgi:hypothetical protein
MPKKQRALKLTHDRLREVVVYNPKTGSMTWRTTRGGKIKAGDPVGTVGTGGYLQVIIDLEVLPGHRLAWFYVHKEWPDGQVCFRNGKHTDIRLANLWLKNKGLSGPVPFSQDRLKQLLSYDPETGKFIWLVTTPRAPKGAEAGVKMGMGYRLIGLDGVRYLAHRLAWFYVHGEWPVEMIDHINGIRDDNRIANLRNATARQNSINSKTSRHNTSGYRGVSFSSRKKKWHARITSEYQVHPLGYFDTKEAAYAAYCEAAKRLHGEFAKT